MALVSSLLQVCRLPNPFTLLHPLASFGNKTFKGSSPHTKFPNGFRCPCRWLLCPQTSHLHLGLAPLACLPEKQAQQRTNGGGGSEKFNKKLKRGVGTVMEEAIPIPPQGFVIISACLVGLLTGFAVVLFNNAVYEIRDIFWDGIPSRGASWLREEPIEEIWQRVILVPICGGVIVGILNSIRSALETTSEGMLLSNAKAALRPFLKAVAASVTLGTGNSLGPEGPSVEIGASIAKGVDNLFETNSERRLSLVAAGSAAGISAGFNAAVAGCFFAVESVLRPSPADSSSSLTNTTPMVILSAVIASVVSEVGLGSDPAFRVPEYDFRSPSELPLYLLLGILCGLVSLTLSRCTSFALTAVDDIHKATGITKAAFPVLGGLAVGMIALAYPEVLYWGFENVDILLESRPFVKGVPADLLLQLVGVKIVATALSRASGLIGGYYAPSLFIGAATGMAYGKFASYAVAQADPIFHLALLEVASPQAYGLVGMAATLAGVCQVPLTSVLLLFELTHDYRIVLPLLGAVGLSSWIASTQTRKRQDRDKMSPLEAKTNLIQQPEYFSLNPNQLSSTSSHTSDLCELESSLCVLESRSEAKKLEERIYVSQAMRKSYVTVLMSTLLKEAVDLMLAEKQPFVLIIDSDNFLVGLLTLGDIQEFSKVTRVRDKHVEVGKLLVSEMWHFDGEKCRNVWTASPNMSLLYAQSIMDRHGVNQLPVVSQHIKDNKRGYPIGVLDRECITLTCRAVATKEFLSQSSPLKSPDS
ncbi:chloride channel E [Tasmannia lanceolata]|uniref:chloride channel E n=1 Tax=Tasmannia lanceolata TaxID=3420 RepID=UPI00406444B0